MTKTNGQAPQPTLANEDSAPAVNRKKQKRRQKQAEKLAASRTDAVNGTRNAAKSSPANTSADAQRAYAEFKKQRAYTDLAYDPEAESYIGSDEEADGYSETYEPSVSPPNGTTTPDNGSRSGKRKGKGKTTQPTQTSQPQATLATNAPPSTLRMSKEKIWNTSSQEERERIKVFWLSLGDTERKSLVKVEKDAVLKKMKEQQRHSCSCTVCGRKRVAIEEELEVLYDAYYEELEQYANNQQGDKMPPMMAGSRRFGALSGLAPPNRLPPLGGRHPSRGRIIEHFGDEEEDEGDEEYSEDEEEDDYETDDDPIEEMSRGTPTDFFNFGQSLTVQGKTLCLRWQLDVLTYDTGGILTVADDLLKNDGKKFIEMMEQLAERRMAREEDAKENYNSNGYPNPATLGLPPHSHHHHHHPPPPPEDEEEYEDDEEEDGDYDTDDEYDEEDMVSHCATCLADGANTYQDTMTEEQRMEEGRRMFQIFAARMFEQRVLTAYKEKVAAERQEKLLQELEEEDEAATQKKAKKAKEAQKKKEKAQQKKLALAEEKAKRDAEKAAEDAKRLAEEAKKAEEARARAEEKRKKRETQRKADEEERLRKEAEKQRRLQEARERQAEQERKAREAKEREKREKEEARLREKEAKEARERENRKKKEKLEREKKEKKESETRAKAEKDAKEQQRRDQLLGRRPQQPILAPAASGFPSGPGLPSSVTAPAAPKAPSPGRSGGLLFKDSGVMPQTPQFGAVSSQSASSNSSTPQTQNSPLPQVLQGRPPSQPFIHQPQANSPMHSALKSSFAAFQPGPFGSMQPMGNTGFPTGQNGFPSPAGFPPMNPTFGSRIHHDPMFANQAFGNQFRPLSGPSGAPIFSGLPPPQGRGFPGQHVPPPGFPPPPNHSGFGGFPPGFGMQHEPLMQMHSRQQSGSAEKSPTEPIGTPVARPAPIRRPGSVSQGSQQSSEKHVDSLTQHLGSSALLDDSDEPIIPQSNLRRASAAPASLGRHGGFATSMAYGGMDPSAFSSSPSGYNTWNGHASPFGTGSLPGPSYMGGWGNSIPSGFGSMSGLSGIPHRTSQPRSVAVRLMLCRACKNLSASSGDEFHTLSAIRQQIDRLNPPHDDPVSDKELLDLCETEGNPNNGGGFFDLKTVEGEVMIRFDADDGLGPAGQSVPGDIGSPIVGSATMMNMGSRFPLTGISAPMGGLGF